MNGKMLSLLKNKPIKLCVLATASKEAKPWTAVVAYAVTNEGDILLSTHTTTKKWQLLKENSHVSLVMGFDFEEPNIQCAGDAELVNADSEEYKNCDELFFAQNPHAAQFKNADTVFIKVKASYVRMTEFGAGPPKIEEWSI